MKRPRKQTPDIYKRNGLLNIMDACEHSGLSRTELYNMEKHGLPFVRLAPKKVFIRIADLDAFIQNRIRQNSIGQRA